MIVPDNKIAVIPTIQDEWLPPFDMNKIGEFLIPLKDKKKREWFSSEFYQCLPLSIGNTYGFAFISPIEFDIMWNGGNEAKDIVFNFYDKGNYFYEESGVNIISHFGHGVVTFGMPVMLRTPPGINLMTTSAPNYPLAGLSPMTGVVESDNLRFTFTINIKVDIPNTWIKVEKGYPLVGIIPVPRYFCDSFELINAETNIAEKEVQEEKIIAREHERVRHFLSNSDEKNKRDRSYFFGKDIRGNKFSDHQIPGGIKK